MAVRIAVMRIRGGAFAVCARDGRKITLVLCLCVVAGFGKTGICSDRKRIFKNVCIGAVLGRSGERKGGGVKS